MPDLTIEQSFSDPIAGVDEVGRGCWAGPVVAAAVVLPSTQAMLPWMKDLNDSKKLSARMRENLFSHIMSCCDVGVGEASVEEIDRLNILQAALLAMTRAVESLATKNLTVVLVDGNKAPPIPWPCRTVIGGDGKSISIAAASIIAKVTRDRHMAVLAKEYPHFRWEKNVGYGTTDHVRALNQNTVTEHHRRSFKPIRKILSSA